MAEPLTVKNLRGCARCGGDHPDPINARAFQIPFAPPEANGMTWTHWFTCPKTGDPVLVSQVVELGVVKVGETPEAPK